MNPTDVADALEPTQRFLVGLADHAPTLVAAVLVLLVGMSLAWVGARLTRYLVRRSGLEAVAERAGVARVLYSLGLRQGIATILSRAVWWGGVLVTAAVVAETVGLPGLADGIGTVIEFLPRLVAASVVGLAGLVGAEFLRGLVHRVASLLDDLDSAKFPATAVYYAVLAVTATLAAEHLGLQTDLVSQLLLVAIGGLVFAFGLAFALGSRDLFREVVSCHYARRLYRAGDEVEVHGVSGVVVGFGPVTVTLRTDEGEVVLPCSALVHSAVRRGRAEASQTPSGPAL